MRLDRHLPPICVRREQLICVTGLRGDGTDGDPERLVYRYYNDSGELQVVVDECLGPVDVFYQRGPTVSESEMAQATHHREAGD